MPTAQHLLRFRATVAGLEEAEGALRGFLDAGHITGGVRYNVELAFEEVAANILRHARPTGDIEVAVRFDDDEIVLTFEDDGVPFDPHPRDRPEPVTPSSLDEAQVGGLGLVLLKKILTRLIYERTPQQHNVLTIGIPAR